MALSSEHTGTIALHERDSEYLANKYRRGTRVPRSTIESRRIRTKGDRLAAKSYSTLLDPVGPGGLGLYHIPDTHYVRARNPRYAPKGIDMVVIHTSEGSSGTSNSDPILNSRSACHYAVTYDGKIFKMVDENLYGICSGAANDRSIGIEHAGWSHMPGPPGREHEGMWGETEWAYGPDKTTKITGWGGLSPQLHASAKLVADIAKRHNIPVDANHIIGHSQDVATTDRSDPGGYWPWDTYYQWIRFYKSTPSWLAKADWNLPEGDWLGGERIPTAWNPLLLIIGGVAGASIGAGFIRNRWR
jgi:N-acetyl-anhydromuramyl-L-alanine amidase AmpD